MKGTNVVKLSELLCKQILHLNYLLLLFADNVASSSGRVDSVSQVFTERDMQILQIASFAVEPSQHTGAATLHNMVIGDSLNLTDFQVLFCQKS